MVDGIGKGGGVPPPAGGPKGPGAPKGPTGTEKTFDVHKTDVTREATAIEKTAATHGPGPLEQLKSGKIDFERYLDIKVNEATSHLEGVAPARLDTIRSMLRERMATDPELIDLVKQATGHVPTVPSDE
jgi:hypothetical protein